MSLESNKPPLWGARVLMVGRACDDARACAEWYATLFGDALAEVGDGVFAVRGAERWLLFRAHAANAVSLAALALPTHEHWVAYRAHVAANGVEMHAVASNLAAQIGADAFAVRDPDRRLLLFTVAPEASPARPAATLARAARLQRVAFPTVQIEAMLECYRDLLGFAESARVVGTDGELVASYLRSDAEHHSVGVQRGVAGEAGMHAYAVADWNALRDWADHCADLEIPIVRGPGRHGVGNDLFFTIRDPEGHAIEFVTEIEHRDALEAHVDWPQGPRVMDLWHDGGAPS